MYCYPPSPLSPSLPPAGHWNVFRFTDYREGIEEDVDYDSLPIDVEREQDVLRLAMVIDLGRIVPVNQALEVGVSAVMKFRSGETSHWALIHSGPGIDFHPRYFKGSVRGGDAGHPGEKSIGAICSQTNSKLFQPSRSFRGI